MECQGPAVIGEQGYGWYNLAMPYPATPEMIRSALAEVIAEYRVMRGLTQEQLSRRAGLSQNAVSDMELGKRGCAFMSFLRMAHGLGVDPAVLLSAVTAQLPQAPDGYPR
jgi:DNA-binding XRE family transcriptional regulator